MSFVSLEFTIFFAIVCAIYFLIRHSLRWVLLLVAGYIFYGAWNPYYLLLIGSTTFIDYLVARWLGRIDPAQRLKRRLVLAISLTTNLGSLFVFKYFNFFNQSLGSVFPSYQPIMLNVLLPVGISFYTFQSVAYTIDVYRGKVQPEKHPGIFAAFVAFFPQLVAGPIERAAHMLPQFRQPITFDYDRVVTGLRIILWGVFKKVVIADRLAIYVNQVYNHVEQYSGLPLLIATVFFAFQIYCDFSGYSDIAIGTGRVLGFNLSRNFRQPYFAQSPREFWRRWHITLSTWFRDYVYIPLGGSRVSLPRQMLNLLIVFLLSGLWHGANWTFAIWGLLHGLYAAVEVLISPRQTTDSKSPVASAAQIVSTFLLVGFAWIFFRANSFNDAAYVITHLAVWPNASPMIASIGSVELALMFASIILLLIADWIDHSQGIFNVLARQKLVVRWTAYYAVAFVILITVFVSAGSSQQFIYFQF